MNNFQKSNGNKRRKTTGDDYVQASIATQKGHSHQLYRDSTFNIRFTSIRIAR